MLPDFRFVIGATLAIALLAVAGLGLVTSVQLVREARMAPLQNARSLAFAGRAEWNQFYDPDEARRFEGMAGNAESPVAEARLETPDETSVIAPPVIAPAVMAVVSPEERTAPPPRIDPDIAPLTVPVTVADLGDDKTSDETPQADRPHTDPLQSTEAPAAATIATGGPVSDEPRTTAPGVLPAERVASAPATSPGADLPQGAVIEPRVEAQTPLQPQSAADPQGDSPPPIPRARPKAHVRRKIARARIVAPPSQPTWPNSGFPNAPWPGYDNQITGATTTKNAGKLTGTLSNRAQ